MTLLNFSLEEDDSVFSKLAYPVGSHHYSSGTVLNIWEVDFIIAVVSIVGEVCCSSWQCMTAIGPEFYHWRCDGNGWSWMQWLMGLNPGSLTMWYVSASLAWFKHGISHGANCSVHMLISQDILVQLNPYLRTFEKTF